jgi:transposase
MSKTEFVQVNESLVSGGGVSKIGCCGVKLPRNSDTSILKPYNPNMALGKRNPNEQASERRVLMQVLARKRKTLRFQVLASMGSYSKLQIS